MNNVPPFFHACISYIIREHACKNGAPPKSIYGYFRRFFFYTICLLFQIATVKMLMPKEIKIKNTKLQDKNGYVLNPAPRPIRLKPCAIQPGSAKWLKLGPKIFINIWLKRLIYQYFRSNHHGNFQLQWLFHLLPHFLYQNFIITKFLELKILKN